MLGIGMKSAAPRFGYCRRGVALTKFPDCSSELGNSPELGKLDCARYARAIMMVAMLAAGFLVLRVAPVAAQEECLPIPPPTQAELVDVVTQNWRGFDVLISSSTGVLSNNLPYGRLASSVDILMLAARIMPYGSDGAGDADRTVAASFASDFSDLLSGFFIQSDRAAGNSLFFRYQVEFLNARGEVFHRAVQCSAVAVEIEGFGPAAGNFPGNADPFMCDWTAGKPESGEQAPLSPYFEQRPSSANSEQAQPALRINNGDDRVVFNNNRNGFSLLEAVNFTVALKPGGAEDGELPRSVRFSLTDWSGTILLSHCSAIFGVDDGTFALPIDEPPTNAMPPAYHGVSEAALIFPEPPPQLTTLNVTTAEPSQEHPATLLGEPVVFTIAISPEYSDGAGDGTALVDLQLSAANAVFLPRAGLILSAPDGSRASIRLSTRTILIQVSVTPDPRVDTSVTVTVVANEDGSLSESLVFTVRASTNLPAALRMELQDEQGQRIDTFPLDAGGGARGRLFVRVLDAERNGLAVVLAGSLELELGLELDGLTGQLMQARVQPGDLGRLPTLPADGSVFDVAFSVPANLLTTVTLVAKNYTGLRGASLPLRFERAAQTRLISGQRLSIGSQFLCGLSEEGTVRCGGQAEVNGGTEVSRTGAQGEFEYEVFEVLDGDAEPTTRLSGVVALGQSVSLPLVSCALLRDGDVACWGESGTRFGGLTISRQAQRIDGLSNVLQLSMGRNFACALVAVTGDEGGTEIHCWGVNNHGQAGQDSGFFIASPQLASGLSSLKGVIQLDAGRTHACALQLDGRVFCWGENGRSERFLGQGNLLLRSTTPVAVAVSNAVQIAVGEKFSCAVSRSGLGDQDRVWCWGGSYHDDVLLEGLSSKASPIAGLATASGARLRQLAIAGPQGCALVDTGELWCWREDAAIVNTGENWVYGNDFDIGGRRQALCFSESGATVPCMAPDAVLQCLAAGQLLDDIRSGQCNRLPEPRSSDNLLTLVADTVDRLLLHSALFNIDRDFPIGDIAEPCGRTDQSCIAQRIALFTEVFNSTDAELRDRLLGFYSLESESASKTERQSEIPVYTIARQLARAEDSLYYRSSAAAMAAGVGPLTAVLEVRLFVDAVAVNLNGGCALRRDSSLWCWGASSLGAESGRHGFWTAGAAVSTTDETVVQLTDQTGYRYAASIVPWDRADAVRVWTAIGIEFFADQPPPQVALDPPVLDLSFLRGASDYTAYFGVRVSQLAGPPDEFGKLRPIYIANNRFAPIMIDPSLPADVTVTLGAFLAQPFQIESAAGTPLSRFSAEFDEDRLRSSVVVGMQVVSATAEPDVFARTDYLKMVLGEDRLDSLSLRLVAGSTEHWSVTTDRYFTLEVKATDRFGYLFDPPPGALELSASRPSTDVSFVAERDVIGGRLLDFSAGVSSRTLRFKRLANFEGPIRVTVAPAEGSEYEDSSATRTFLDIEVPRLDVSRFRLQFEVLEQQPDIDAPARYRVNVDTLDVNGLVVTGLPELTTGIGLRTTLVDTAGNQYPFVVDNLRFQGSLAQVDFAVNLQGYDATVSSAELTGASRPSVTSAAEFELIAVETLVSLTVAGPSSTPTQLALNEPALFTVTVTGVGSKGTRAWRSQDVWRLQYTAPPRVMVVVYEPVLRFSAGVARVTVSVLPLLATDTSVTFHIAGDSGDLAGVTTNMTTVAVVAALPPSDLEVSILPSELPDVAPFGRATVKLLLRVGAKSFDGRPVNGLRNDLRVRAIPTEVAFGVTDENVDVFINFPPLVPAAAGVYETTLRVTFAAGKVSVASIQAAVAYDLAGEPVTTMTTVQLKRRITVGRSSVSLSDSVLVQLVPGGSVQTTATVVVVDQFERPFMPTGVRLRAVDVSNERVALVTTPDLVFSPEGTLQLVLTLRPPRGRDQDLRVEVAGAIEPEAIITTAALSLVRLIAVEVLGSLTLVGPSTDTTLAQTMPAETVFFELSITAAGTKGTRPWQPTEMLRLQHMAGPGVSVVYESTLRFSAAGVATVTVSVTPSPGTDALVTFGVDGAPGGMDGVEINPLPVAVLAVEILGGVRVTALDGAEQAVSLRAFSVAVELMLEREGERPLTAATTLTLRLQAAIDDSSGELIGPSLFDVFVAGEVPAIVEIEAMFSGDAVATTISLSVTDGVPVDIPVAFSPADTVTVSVGVDLDFNGNGRFDLADALLILKFFAGRLPDDILVEIENRLRDLLSPESLDRRLDVDGNGLVAVGDVRFLLRYMAGLRGESLTVDGDAAFERRLREVIESGR